MSLRIAFDLDGLLADMDTARRREEERLFGPASPTPVRGAHRLTSQQQQKLSQALAAIDDLWETLEEIEKGAVAAISERARARRWEILFLTSRPETAGSTPQLQTQRWLLRHGFELPSVFVVSESRGKIAEALQLDVVVDDRPENCLDVLSDSTATAILVWRHAPDALPADVRQLGCTVTASVQECLSILEAMEIDGEPPTLLGRLRNAFRRVVKGVMAYLSPAPARSDERSSRGWAGRVKSSFGSSGSLRMFESKPTSRRTKAGKKLTRPTRKDTSPAGGGRVVCASTVGTHCKARIAAASARTHRQTGRMLCEAADTS